MQRAKARKAALHFLGAFLMAAAFCLPQSPACAQAVYEPVQPSNPTASAPLDVPVAPPVAGVAPGLAPPVPAAPATGSLAPEGMDVQEPDEADMPEPPRGEAVPPAPLPQSPAKPGENGDTQFSAVVLQGLNKVTARAETIVAPIGSVVRFGTIEIVAHTCWKSAPEDRPENAALLEISEVKQGEAPQRIFLGWMFSSSPGLSSLEHPFYDVTVVKCSKTGGEELEGEPKPANAPFPPVKKSPAGKKQPSL